MPPQPKKSIAKILRKPTTDEDAKRLLERMLYRYLSKIITKVVQEYDISEQDAEMLHDKLVNMNLIECCVEDEEGAEAEDGEAEADAEENADN